MSRIIVDATVWLNFGRADAVSTLVNGLPNRLAVGLVVERQEVRVWPADSAQAGQPFSLEEFVARGILERAVMTAAELAMFHATKTQLRLGDGETEAIVVASSRGWTVATDDGPARRRIAAHRPSVPITGSVGLLRVLVQARAITRLEAARLLALMRGRGGRLPDQGL
jgi:predicted nucleic acid-binding protein